MLQYPAFRSVYHFIFINWRCRQIYLLLSFNLYWTFRDHTPQLSLELFLLYQWRYNRNMKTIQLGDFSNSGELFLLQLFEIFQTFLQDGLGNWISSLRRGIPKSWLNFFSAISPTVTAILWSQAQSTVKETTASFCLLCNTMSPSQPHENSRAWEIIPNIKKRNAN